MTYRPLHNAIRTAPRPAEDVDEWTVSDLRGTTWEEETAIGLLLQSRSLEYLVWFWVAVAGGALFGAILTALVWGLR